MSIGVSRRVLTFSKGSSHITIIIIFYKLHTWRQDVLAFWPVQLHGLGG